MTDNLRRSISSGDGSSQNMPQGITEAHAPTTAEVATSSDRQSGLILDSQALQILDSSDDCIKVLDLEGRILFMSRGGHVLLGIEDIKPFLNTSWIEFWQGADRQAAMDAIAQAKTGKVCMFQGYCPTPSGEPKWWDIKVSPIRGIDGQVERLLCISRDITERKRVEDERNRRESNTAFLDEISQVLSRLSTPDEIMQALGARMGEFLNLSGCVFADVDEAQNEITVHHGWTTAEVPSLKQTFRMGEYLTEEFSRANRAGEPVIVHNTAHDERTDAENYAQLRVGSFITVPFHQHGRWRGYTAVTKVVPYEWRADEIELLQEVSSRIFPRIERARAEAALRTNEARMRGQKESLQAAVNGASLADSLAILARLAAEETAGEARTAFYLVNAEGSSLHPVYGAGSMPDAYLDRVNGFAIGKDSLACGLAIPTGRLIVTRDVAEEPLWQSWLHLAEAFDYRGCWFFPIQTRDRKDVGRFAMYFREPREASLHDLALAEIVTQSAAVIINSHCETQERTRAEAALRESEAKYRSLFESMDEGFCLIEVLFDESGQAFDYRFLEANPAFEKHTGLVDVIGKTVREFVPQHETHWFEIYGRIARTGVPERFENAAQALGRFYDVYAFRMGEPQERKVAVLFNDINDRKQAEAAIAADLRDTQLLRDLSAQLATEDSIQALYQEILTTAIALTHADAGTVQILDETTQDLLLLATQGFEQSVIEHFYRVDASSHTSCGIALKSGVRSFVDFDVPESEDPDGSMRIHVEAGYLSAQSTPLISRSGKPIGMVSTHWHTRHRPGESVALLRERCVSESSSVSADRELRFLDLLARQAADLIEQRQDAAQRKQLLEREQAAREEAEEANRIKDEFLAVLSHELRSPLNPILGWSKLLQNGKLDETKTAQALATIERNAKLQSELIEDLLDVSRILRGKLSLNAAPVNLAVKIRGAMETVQLSAEAKSIQIEASLAEDVGLVWGDSTRLQQVAWNLLSNAVKFTPRRGQVNIRLERLGSSAQITVSDTGQGIAPDFLPYVFDYFRQANGATTRKFGGLGLGLAIVRHLVELHGGTVRADSLGEGQGATFTIRLPLMLTPSQTNQDERSPQQSLDLSDIKILVVDDEPDTRELVAFVLEQQGAQVTTATSAHEALLVLPQAKPDVLLSDIGMPEMDGYMLIQQVRALTDQGGQIPAIALTAYAGDTNQQQVLAAGFQKHISKPIEPAVLVQTIVHLIHRN